MYTSMCSFLCISDKIADCFSINVLKLTKRCKMTPFWSCKIMWSCITICENAAPCIDGICLTCLSVISTQKEAIAQILMDGNNLFISVNQEITVERIDLMQIIKNQLSFGKTERGKKNSQNLLNFNSLCPAPNVATVHYAGTKEIHISR